MAVSGGGLPVLLYTMSASGAVTSRPPSPAAQHCLPPSTVGRAGQAGRWLGTRTAPGYLQPWRPGFPARTGARTLQRPTARSSSREVRAEDLRTSYHQYVSHRDGTSAPDVAGGGRSGRVLCVGFRWEFREPPRKCVICILRLDHGASQCPLPTAQCPVYMGKCPYTGGDVNDV